MFIVTDTTPDPRLAELEQQVLELRAELERLRAAEQARERQDTMRDYMRRKRAAGKAAE